MLFINKQTWLQTETTITIRPTSPGRCNNAINPLRRYLVPHRTIWSWYTGRW